MLPLCRGLLCFPCTLLSHRVGRASGGRNTTREPLCFRGLRCPSVSGTLLPFTLWLSRACHGLELSTKTALGNGVHCLLPPHYAGPPPRPRAPAGGRQVPGLVAWLRTESHCSLYIVTRQDRSASRRIACRDKLPGLPPDPRLRRTLESKLVPLTSLRSCLCFSLFALSIIFGPYAFGHFPGVGLSV